MRFARFVLNRRNVQSQLLRNPQLLDEVQYQVEGMAQVHPSITVYRNDDRINVYRNPPGVTDRGNVVVTAPMGLEQRHGTLSRILGSVNL